MGESAGRVESARCRHLHSGSRSRSRRSETDARGTRSRAADPGGRPRRNPERDCARRDRRPGRRGGQTRSVLQAVCIHGTTGSRSSANVSRAERDAPMNTKIRAFVVVCAVTAIAVIVGADLQVGPYKVGPSLYAQTGAVQYEADLSWPKPLPNRWALGGLGGVCVD